MKVLVNIITGYIATGVIVLRAIINNYFNRKYDKKVNKHKLDGEEEAMESLSILKRKASMYQIDEYENIEGLDFIGENEVLTLTKKDSNLSYFSIYNLITKEFKDYTEGKIGEFLSISFDKSYVIYSEPRNVPKVKSEEWKKVIGSGDFKHKNIKILNLITGEISDVKTEQNNIDAEFEFISNNKILANYLSSWEIMDVEGKVCNEGVHNNWAYISGIDDLKDLGHKVEGKFYYTELKEHGKGTGVGAVCSIDINTKEIKRVYENSNFLNAYKRGRVILVDKENENDGVYKNITFGYYILDEGGKIIHYIDSEHGRLPWQFTLSFDGSKAFYVERPIHIEGINNINTEVIIKIIDTKTGNIYKLVNVTELKDEDDTHDYCKRQRKCQDNNSREKKRRDDLFITNICWDKRGTSLIFNLKYFSYKKQKDTVNTYRIRFNN